MPRLIAPLIALSLLTFPAFADTSPAYDPNNIIKTPVKTHRSSSAKRAFRASNPCPATGKSKGACPGYVIDHITPLCAGGADEPGNTQWQTVEERKAKDKLERRECSRRN